VLHWDDTPLDALLLDLDDTILDNQAGLAALQDEVARLVAARSGAEPARTRAQLAASSRWFWSDDARHRAGRLDMRAARRAVLVHLLESIGRPDPTFADELTALYCDRRDASLVPFAGALEALARLRAALPALGLVTNGAAGAQRAKIERFGLARFFDTIAIEGEVGAGKPDARVFARALDALRARAPHALMAGDDFSCDVLGALGAGLHAVWIDPARRAAPPAARHGAAALRPARAHRTVGSLAELVEALGIAGD
jgi:HAD superfamily hydrolase (TIGR01509 family)